MKIIETQLIAWIGTCIVMAVFFVGLTFQIRAIEGDIKGATIAGTTVPAVHCQEDEVISWTGPDALGCVHFEEVK
jgi:hypothetical protein